MFREQIFDKIKLPAVAAILLLLLCSAAYAAVEIPDENMTGSICVTLTSEDTGEAISGGSITLYKTGDVVHDDDWNYGFKLTDEFAESGCSLDDPDKRNAETARELAKYAGEKNLKGIQTAAVSEEGKAEFSGLNIGLYLLVQTEASKGYYPVNPFMVSLPFYDETTQTYRYLNIDAFPKTEPAKELPAETEPEPGESKPEEIKPSDISPHPGSGGGSGNGSAGSHGGSSVGSDGGPGVNESGMEGESDIRELFPLPQTGQGRALLAGVTVFVLSAMVLGIVIVGKFAGRR